jgi:UDP-2-acetamido-2,6-beta-L-arabino-hexul-4-ose reductase
MRIAVTGAAGFLGWHTRCRAYALGLPCVPITRRDFEDPARLTALLAGVDAVVHCAGVSRGAAVFQHNRDLADRLVSAIGRLSEPPGIVYANSVHTRGDGEYGAAKHRAGEILREATPNYCDVILPNLFGEHGRPRYNSFVSTFCAEVALGEHPVVSDDREIPLLAAQDAADRMIREAAGSGHRTVEPRGEPVTIAGVLALLHEFEAVYRTGELPDLSDRFRARLFSTYRSYLFPTRYPIPCVPHTDSRGTLIECARVATGGQAFVSSTQPGATRGEHVHLRKFERFLVIAGSAEIALRRLFTTEVIRFHVDGAKPALIDMPAMWAHRITAVGPTPVTTFFWCNERYETDDPDTFSCAVDSPEVML